MSVRDRPLSLGRVYGEARAEWNSFLRKPAAVFFTFVFPAILVGLFAAVVAGGFFDRQQAFYYPGYLGFVVLLTPLSRLGSTVARGRESRRFEKLSTTPLSRVEWLTAHVAVNGVLILCACVLITVLLTIAGVSLVLTPVSVAVTAVAVAVAVVAFCGLGSLIGAMVSSDDGAIAASNAVGFPMLFLADTFVSPDALPGPVAPVVELLPLTYFSRSVRSATLSGDPQVVPIGVLAVFAVVFFAAGAYTLPWTE